MVLKGTDWKPCESGNEKTQEHAKNSRQENDAFLVPGQGARASKRGSDERGSENNSFLCRGKDWIRVELGHGAAAFSRVLVPWQEADSE